MNRPVQLTFYSYPEHIPPPYDNTGKATMSKKLLVIGNYGKGEIYETDYYSFSQEKFFSYMYTGFIVTEWAELP